MDPKWDSKIDRRWEWIQVEVDIKEGLVGNVDIIFSEFGIKR
jgi:hypothetical protein